MLIISYATKAPNRDAIANLTFGTLTLEEKQKNKNSYTWVDILISLVVVLIVIGVLVFFNGK